MAVEFGTGKTICILAIVAGCFAVLWPKLFYPMLQASISTRIPIDNSQGHHRQERPPHLHRDILHPALRERGRAIPHSHVPRVVEKEGRGEDVLYEKRKEMASAVQEEVHNLQQSSLPSDTTEKVDDSSKHDHRNGGGKPKVQVMGMEMTASCEGGQRWSRPSTPILAIPSHSHSGTPISSPTPEPQSIYLEGALPSQSQLLVSESETQAVAVDPEDLGSDTDAPIVLSGKMTLSLISLDAALAAEDEQFSCKEPVLDTKLNEKQKLQELKSALRDETAHDAPTTSEEEKEKEEIEEDEVQGHRRGVFQHLNDTGHVDDALTTTNYTTASTAAEATGSEETAADYSALESFGPSDDQQDELEDEEEEVWNGDVGCAEEESEEEAAQAAPQNMQQQQQH